MLDRIKALTAENKRLGQQCEGLMQAGMNNGQALILAEAKLAKAVAFLDDLWDSGDYFAGELNDLRKELKGDIND
jgi:hypothetical protein